MADRYILYDLPDEPPDAPRRVLRLTVGEMTAVGWARMRRYQREAAEWSAQAVPADQEAPLDEETAMQLSLRWQRATMLGALKRVEVGECAADAEEPDTWQAGDLPAAWQTEDGFLNGMPGRLFDLWLGLAAETNPEAAGIAATDEKKRRGAISVR